MSIFPNHIVVTILLSVRHVTFLSLFIAQHLVFLKQDLNTKKLRQDRMEEIERDNRLLLDKMARIMTAKREDTLAEFTPVRSFAAESLH